MRVAMFDPSDGDEKEEFRQWIPPMDLTIAEALAVCAGIFTGFIRLSTPVL